MEVYASCWKLKVEGKRCRSFGDWNVGKENGKEDGTGRGKWKVNLACQGESNKEGSRGWRAPAT